MTDKESDLGHGVIVADKLSKVFGTHKVVNQVSFEISRREIFGFLGPNGSGKSTVIRMLCGLLNPTEGEGRIEGLNTLTEGDQIRRKVGYMSQKFGLYPDLTVQQNLEFYGRIYGLDDRGLTKRINEVVSHIHLAPYLNRKAGMLSGGWKQRLGLACAILHRPSVLFLDEPTAGIDPVARREVWDLLFDLSKEGMTMLVTTHYMDEAERCQRVGYIYLSRLIALGKVDELTHLPGLFPPDYLNWTIQGQPLMVIYAFLQSQSFVSEVTLFGQQIHIQSKQEVSKEQIADLIREHTGCQEPTILPSHPSLEDVFVRLTRLEMAKTN
ncbi:MAG: ABC transporter ATP-binding protein [Candidatus Caenarcaniphilales bacterium]|nr:ABC transporter ATP-binding protein [Candidatus Caenarcaniphilales bacterium]